MGKEWIDTEKDQGFVSAALRETTTEAQIRHLKEIRPLRVSDVARKSIQRSQRRLGVGFAPIQHIFLYPILATLDAESLAKLWAHSLQVHQKGVRSCRCGG